MHVQQVTAVTAKEDDLPALVASQKWKLWLLGALFAAAGLGFLFTDGIARGLNVDPFAVRMGTLLITFGTLAAAFLSVRCPNCGLRLVMHAMSHQSVGQWLQWLLTVKKCPRCGLSEPHGDQRPARRQGE
jgi:DNA-directed RNA polymerase subunit RPC12/RpoP